MPAKTSPYHLFASGLGYFEAAKMILISPHYPTKQVQIRLPLSALLAFAAEFMLKAWLMEHDFSEKEVSVVQLRHDLERLLTIASYWGLAGLHPSTHASILELAGHHKKHEFRYLPADSTFSALNFSQAVDVLAQLEVLVRRAVHADVIAAEVQRTGKTEHPSSKPR